MAKAIILGKEGPEKGSGDGEGRRQVDWQPRILRFEGRGILCDMWGETVGQCKSGAAAI